MGASAGGEAPTQIFQDGAPSGEVTPPAASTMRLGEGGYTEGVGGQRPTEYQPQAAQQTSALIGQPFGSRPLAVGGPPPPRRRRGLWVFALLSVFVLGAGLASGAALLWWRAKHTGTVVRVIKTGPPPSVPEYPEAPPIPDLPPDIGARVREAMKALEGHGIPLPLDESGAVVSGDDTTITRTFDLNSDASFKAHVITGDVTVVGSDDADETTLKVVKHGGSVQERASTQVLAAESEEGIMLVSTGAGGRVSVSYELTVPRKGLHKLELSAQKGDIKVSQFDGELELNVTNGSVSVATTSGAVRSRVVNGKTSVTYDGRHEEDQEFTVVNGDIEVSLSGEPEVDLKAASTNGRVEVDGALPLKSEKGGRKVEAELGGGGAPLDVKVVNGNIRIKQ